MIEQTLSITSRITRPTYPFTSSPPPSSRYHNTHTHKQIQSLKAESNQAADQAISLVRLVRVFAAEEVEKRRYDTKTLANVAAELRVKMLWTVCGA